MRRIALFVFVSSLSIGVFAGNNHSKQRFKPPGNIRTKEGFLKMTHQNNAGNCLSAIYAHLGNKRFEMPDELLEITERGSGFSFSYQGKSYKLAEPQGDNYNWILYEEQQETSSGTYPKFEEYEGHDGIIRKRQVDQQFNVEAGKQLVQVNDDRLKKDILESLQQRVISFFVSQPAKNLRGVQSVSLDKGSTLTISSLLKENCFGADGFIPDDYVASLLSERLMYKQAQAKKQSGEIFSSTDSSDEEPRTASGKTAKPKP
jgi:hypothetical protein